MGVPGQKPQNGGTTFLNLLILEHLKRFFIKALNKFLICFEINGLKYLKLTILRFFAGTRIVHTTLIAVKTFLLLKHHEFT